MSRVILFTLFFLQIFISFSQNGEVLYIKKMRTDFIDTKKTTKKVENFIEFSNKINSSLKGVSYKLKFNSIESLFKVFKSKMEIGNSRNLKLAINFGGGRGTFYTNQKTKEIIHKANGYGELFLIKDSQENNKWVITQEEKIINGYKCFKAILKKEKNTKSKYDTYAWFSTKLSFGYGPLGYGNLPGLIVELHLNNGFSFYLKKINFFKKEMKIIKPIKGVEITKEEFLKLGKATMKNR